MSGTLWPALIAGQKARASDVEAKFDWLEGDLVPMSGGAITTGVYDLGTSTAAWRYLHIFPTGGIMCSGATSMAFLSDGKVKLKSGGGINEFSIDGTFGGNSDDAVPTEKAVKTYVDTQVLAQPKSYNAGSATPDGNSILVATLTLSVTTARMIHVSAHASHLNVSGIANTAAFMVCVINTTTGSFNGNHARAVFGSTSDVVCLGFDAWVSVTSGTFDFKLYREATFAGSQTSYNTNFWVI